ncbi:CoA transferase [Promicromonospora sp. MS192]|uniref:CoA transferase n=1 Tax=Promicromonospora sp. MS192 TaxID=3412684 RepID=UPI003C2DE92F
MEPWLAAHLPVLDLALDAVRAVQHATRRAGGSGGAGAAGGRAATRAVHAEPDARRVAAAFASDRLFALDGRPVAGFAELSGFFRTADGWVRTHANYPHHRARLTALAGLPDDVGRPAFAQRLAELSAHDLEDGAAAAGAIVARVRTEQEWRESEPGRAAAAGPLVRVTPASGPGDATRSLARHARAGGSPADRSGAASAAGGTAAGGIGGGGKGGGVTGGGAAPLSGVRVLDLTRVIAGPVATRTLALLGADVLRVDPPDPAEIPWQHLDTGQGKRSTVLDLRDGADLRTAQELLDAADVLVTGYRPGAVEALGLRVPPGVVTGRVSAWGDTGPWAGRRGFDSIVQAASGIALLEGHDGVPGALPAQALDHASGYLLAAGIVDALTLRDGGGDGAPDGGGGPGRRAPDGGDPSRGRSGDGAAGRTAGDGLSRDVSVSLARTATWLLDLPGRDPLHPPAATPDGPTVTHTGVTTACPALPGYADYPHPAHAWSTDPPTWPS